MMASSLALVSFETDSSLAVSSLSSSSESSESSWGPFIFFFALRDLVNASSGVAGASVDDDCDRPDDALAGGTFVVVASFTLGDDPMKLSGSTAIVLYCRAF